MPRVLLLITTGLLFASACDRPATPTETWTASDHAQAVASPVQRAPAPAAAPIDPAQARIQASTALFRMVCAECHGDGGEGDGPEAPGAMPNFQDPAWQSSLTDDELASIIQEGRGLMPAFGGRLPESSVRAVIAHIRRLQD